MEDGIRQATYGAWFTIVPAQPPEDAERSWLAWCDVQSEIPSDDNIRVDSGRADDSPFRRYMVRRSTLPLHQWWERVSSDLPGSVQGLWFGLTDVVQDEGPPLCTMYVVGAGTFDAQDGGDWATDPIWEPNGRYLVVPEIAKSAEISHVAAEELLARLVRELRPEVASVNVAGVAVGFDGGDAIVVWEREQWTLWAEAELLGCVDVTVIDQPWTHGRWRPTAAFDTFAAFFAESLQSLHDDDFEAWQENEASLKRSGVHMRHPDGSVVPESLLHIDGEAAWFRWSDEPFDNSQPPARTAQQ